MSLFKLLSAAVVIAGILTASAFGESDSMSSTSSKSMTSSTPWLQTKLFGYGDYQYGQIVRGQYPFSGGDLDHFSIQQAVVQVGGEAKSNNGFSAVVIGQGVLSFPFCLPSDGQSTGGFGCYTSRYSWNLKQSELKYTLGNPEVPFLTVGAGLFPFKYNPDARDFGDYLLRISPYPQFLQTSFDVPDAEHMLGLHVGSSISPWSPDQLALHQDLMLTSETTLWPLQDFSLSYMVNSTIFKFLDLGAGIMWDRLLPASAILDKPAASINPDGFTFQGTKVMVRGALDFKTILPFKNLWGKEDWRAYSEVCLNGLKNYPDTNPTSNQYPGYNNLSKRMPVLLGFNVPTCKLLDELSIEAEWWDNNMANSYWGVFVNGYVIAPDPFPYSKRNRDQPYAGPWYWAVYAKKTLFHNIELVAQAARDHTFIETSQTGIANGDPQEAMDGLGNWAWWLKIQYNF